MRLAGKRIAASAKTVGEAIIGWTAVAVLKGIRLIDRRFMANVSAFILRHVGPLLPEHRLGRANLVAAFPEKSPAEIEQILSGVWDNLGRVAAEFAHLDHIRVFDFEHPGPADVIYDEASIRNLNDVRRAGKPILLFAAHFANWEIPALAAAVFKVDTAVLYRRPNIRAINDAIVKMRAGCMGTLIPSSMAAPVQLANVLERGGHVGMLVDQHYTKGVDVTFFGRTCKANPLIAQLARHTECPIRGIRTLRLPSRNDFWGELTQPIIPPRDAEGKIDIQGTMQAITSVIEEWVRANPEQWLWLHRRWR